MKLIGAKWVRKDLSRRERKGMIRMIEESDGIKKFDISRLNQTTE